MLTYNPYSLEGKTILITGASSGIGETTAIECSKMGANVIITGRNELRLTEVFANLENHSDRKHQMIIAELNDEDSLINLVGQINSIDGLVNNAGVNRVKPIQYIKQGDFDFVFQTNLYAGFNLLRLLLKNKKINNNSSLVFTSSVSAFFNAPGRALYASSKAALTSLMRSFAIELANKGIRANAVHPGLVETKLIHENLSDEELQNGIVEYPLKRYGKPEDIAWAIIYLLSDASSWVTGSSFTIDGGFMLK